MKVRFLAFAAAASLLCLARAAAADTATLFPAKDNTLYESTAGAFSNGAGSFMFAGRSADGVKRRAVLAFDLSSIPAGATVTSANLTLYMSRTLLIGPIDFELHRLLASWGEGASNAVGGGGAGAASQPNDATWIHRFFSGTLWTNPGGDFAPAVSATQSVNDVGSYTWGSTAGLVADVQGWLVDPSTNFGWILVGGETVTPSAKRFGTREAAAAAERPLLSITYSATVGLERATWSAVQEMYR